MNTQFAQGHGGGWGVDEQQTEDVQHQQKSEANLQGPIKEPEMNEEI